MTEASRAHGRAADLRAVIFDMDGVLTDSEPAFHAAVNDILARYGKHVALDEYVQFIGMATEQMWSEMIALKQVPARLEEIMTVQASDTAKTWELGADGSYTKLGPNGTAVRAQQRFIEILRERVKHSDTLARGNRFHILRVPLPSVEERDEARRAIKKARRRSTSAKTGCCAGSSPRRHGDTEISRIFLRGSVPPW